MEVEAERIKRAYDIFKDRLTDRETDVISRFYGFAPEVRNTLSEIGEKYGVTRERIRQIKTVALDKLEVRSKK